MNRECEKILYEHSIFLSFLRKAGIDIDHESIRHGEHTLGEPDILCKNMSGDCCAFELGRLINPDLMQVQMSWNPQNGTYVRTRDYSGDIAEKKLTKVYKVSCPIDLVLYTEFPNGTPESFILLKVRSLTSTIEHSYNRVWLKGSELHLLHESS